MDKKRECKAEKSRSGPDKQTGWHRTFLTFLASTGNVRVACERAGVARQTAYNHRHEIPEFGREWELALDDAVDVLEEEARRRALDRSDKLLEYLLKRAERANRGASQRTEEPPTPRELRIKLGIIAGDQ